MICHDELESKAPARSIQRRCKDEVGTHSSLVIEDDPIDYETLDYQPV